MVDVTNITNINSLQGMAAYANNATDGILFIGMMFAVFIIITMVLSYKNQNPIENNLAVASWAVFIVSIFFWYAHLIPTGIVIVFLILTTFSTLYLYASKPS